MRGPGHFYSPHRLRLLLRVWLLVWALLFSSTVVSAGQYWVHQHGGMACHEGSKSSDSENHLEHCQLCLIYWVGLESPETVRGQSFVGWASPLDILNNTSLRWYALHNLTTGPPVFD